MPWRMPSTMCGTRSCRGTARAHARRLVPCPIDLRRQRLAAAQRHAQCRKRELARDDDAAEAVVVGRHANQDRGPVRPARRRELRATCPVEHRGGAKRSRKSRKKPMPARRDRGRPADDVVRRQIDAIARIGVADRQEIGAMVQRALGPPETARGVKVSGHRPGPSRHRIFGRLLQAEAAIEERPAGSAGTTIVCTSAGHYSETPTNASAGLPRRWRRRRRNPSRADRPSVRSCTSGQDHAGTDRLRRENGHDQLRPVLEAEQHAVAGDDAWPQLDRGPVSVRRNASQVMCGRGEDRSSARPSPRRIASSRSDSTAFSRSGNAARGARKHGRRLPAPSPNISSAKRRTPGDEGSTRLGDQPHLAELGRASR